MKIHLRQTYIEPQAVFPFTWHAQVMLSKYCTKLVKASNFFVEKYDKKYEITFNIIAKHEIADNLILGPAVYKKTKDVEYTIFLPFDVIRKKRNVNQWALKYLFKGVYHVLESLEMDVSTLKQKEAEIIQAILDDPKMTE
jgi:hypothetical protein